MNAPSTLPALGTFAHVMLVCEDMAATRDFYISIFGMSATFDSPDWIVLDLAPNISLTLHPRQSDAHLDVCPGSTFLAFRVADTDAFVARAAQSGARIATPAHDEPFGRLAILLDPNGYSWQISTPNA
jgi:catechol 2,3-dioxygenase-like lactoylglutathione lyase family enzyme